MNTEFSQRFDALDGLTACLLKANPPVLLRAVETILLCGTKIYQLA